jgi:Cys-rich protein (TIGR01571 family)
MSASLQALVVWSSVVCSSAAVVGEHHAQGVHAPLSVDAVASLAQEGQSFLKRLERDVQPIQPGSDEEAITDVKAMTLVDATERFLGFVIWLILYICLASYYHKYVMPETTFGEKEGLDDFSTTLFGCNEHPTICFWSCCCPGIRWADTAARTKITEYWIAFAIVTAMYCLMFLPIANCVVFLLIVGYMTYARQAFREFFSLEKGGSTFAIDCCSYLWCFACTIAQDARHVHDCKEPVIDEKTEPAADPAPAAADPAPTS